MAHSSWLVARGSWLTDFGSWLVAHGSWLIDFGSWLVARGSQFDLPVCFVLAQQDVGFPFNLGGLWLSPMHQF